MAAETIEKLTKIVDKALADPALADQLFANPDAVAAEHGLSENEKLVLKQMNRAQFEEAKKDAVSASGGPEGKLSESEMGQVVGGVFSGGHVGIASKMVVGRAIMAATGGNYSKMSRAACECCAWKGGSVFENALRRINPAP
jgi:hypothetical protein